MVVLDVPVFSRECDRGIHGIGGERQHVFGRKSAVVSFAPGDDVSRVDATPSAGQVLVQILLTPDLLECKLRILYPTIADLEGTRPPRHSGLWDVRAT